MGFTSEWQRLAVSTALVSIVFAATLPAQGKGKGEGKQTEKGRGADARPANRGGAAAQPRADRGNKGMSAAKRADPGNARGPDKALNVPRRETRSDQRIERKLEREFAGDVDLLRGRGNAARSRFMRDVAVSDLRPSVRRFFEADRAPRRIAAGAVARAQLRGLNDDDLVITPLDDRVRILNRSGILLIDLDDERARNLGRWDVAALDGRVAEGSPAFCRSGAGHPVFGREWCLDKGFGLGADRDLRWARTTRLDDVVFLQPVSTASLLAREAVLAVLGPVAFDRLALHAITLGLVDPLVGRWMGEPSGSQVLLLTSGERPVAEIVDANRDNRADVMLVSLRDW